MNRPVYILFAGINGAGKSTLYRSEVWQHGTIIDAYPRINTDEILAAQGKDWRNEKEQLRAGREAVQLIKTYLTEKQSFNQETTLAGRSIVKHIKKAHEAGYYLTLFYVGVEDVSIAQARVAEREAIGGHGVKPELVKRRYKASVNNLLQVIDMCDEAYLYDNTILQTMVARFECGELVYCSTDNPAITWHYDIIQQLGYELVSL